MNKNESLRKIIERENRKFARTANYNYCLSGEDSNAAQFVDASGICLTTTVTEEFGFLFVTIEAPVYGPLTISKRIILQSILGDVQVQGGPLVSQLRIQEQRLVARSRLAFCNGITREELRSYSHRLQAVAADARACRAAMLLQLDLAFTFQVN